MRVLQAVVLCLSTFGAPAGAGPWARGEGEAFLSVVPEWSLDRLGRLENTVSAYAEYGLGRRLTLGADVFSSATGRTGFLFLRRTLTAPARTWQVAVSGGLGQSRGGAQTETLGVAGLSAGRSFETPLGWGWADMALQARVFDGRAAVKLDTTLGLTPRDGWRIYGQLQLADYPGAAASARLQLSSIHRLTTRLSLEVGTTHGLVEDDRTGLRLGLWAEF